MFYFIYMNLIFRFILLKKSQKIASFDCFAEYA